MPIHVQLRFPVPPKIVPFGSDESSNFGDAVQLNCLVASGDLPVQLTWSFHGSEDSAKRKQEGVSIMKIGSKSSILTIESLQAHHSGNYTCSAKNGAGIDDFTTSIVVNGIVTLHPNNSGRYAALAKIISPYHNLPLPLLNL